MTKLLPLPPPDIPRISAVELLAPRMRVVIRQLIDTRKARYSDGRASNDEDSLTQIFETRRTKQRQQYLYGFGRDYDERPPRGKVTNVYDPSFGWHAYDMAVDIIHPKLHWDAPQGWWEQLAKDYESLGLRAGRRFKSRPDSPHGQWLGPRNCPATPTAQDRADWRVGRIEEVWARYKVGA